MNFLADESVDQQIVDRLREDGHTVVYVAEMDPGIDDKDVLNAANQQMALLITQIRVSVSWFSASVLFPWESCS